MSVTVLVTRAGTGASNNLLRSLRAGLPDARLVGVNSDRFVLKKAPADLRVLLPNDHAALDVALLDVVEREGVDLVIAGDDGDVVALGALRRRLERRLFLPSDDAIARCQDKLVLAAWLAARAVPVPETVALPDSASVGAAWARLGGGRLWCRLRQGSGSRGAIPVTDPAQVLAWIDYWERMRDVPPGSFTLAEYLPGRDYACQSLWKDGDLVLVKTVERLSYFGGGSSPSGVSSTPALAKTVVAPRVVEVCRAAVRALDPQASGVFAIDLKENAGGEPCVTEVNAGRFFMITPVFDLTGKRNMAATYVRLALAESLGFRDEYEIVEDYYLVRDLDTWPAIHHADEFFEGIEEVG